MSVVRERRDGDMGAVTFGEIIEMTAAVRRASIARVATPRPGWSTPRAASGLELPASWAPSPSDARNLTEVNRAF